MVPSDMTRYVFLFVCCMLVASCGSNNGFDGTTRIESPKIIAITHTPAGLAPNENTVFEPVVALPFYSQGEAFYDWQLCVFADGAEGQFACHKEVPGLPIDNLIATSKEPRFVFTQGVITQQMLNEVCLSYKQQAVNAGMDVALAEQSPACTEGMNVTLRLKLCMHKPDCEDNEAVITTKSVALLRDDYANNPERNQNPIIRSLRIDGEKAHASMPTVLKITQEIQDFPLSLDVDLNESAQFFSLLIMEQSPDGKIDGHIERVQEQLKVNWYATGGVFSKASGRIETTNTALSNLTDNTLTLDARDFDDGEQIKIWAVLQDSRMGTDAVEYTVSVSK